MNTVVLMALQAEAPDLVQHPWIFFSGVGKINAAVTATEIIMQHRPQRLVNFGTAGGITVGEGLWNCTRFVQRDMACQALGCVPGQTPFEHHVYIGTHRGLTCSTGDNFVMNPKLDISADIVDMEAYAIAKVCERHGVAFECWKYITDQANDHAHDQWQQQVSEGQSHYVRKLRQFGIL